MLMGVSRAFSWPSCGLAGRALRCKPCGACACLDLVNRGATELACRARLQPCVMPFVRRFCRFRWTTYEKLQCVILACSQVCRWTIFLRRCCRLGRWARCARFSGAEAPSPSQADARCRRGALSAEACLGAHQRELQESSCPAVAALVLRCCCTAALPLVASDTPPAWAGARRGGFGPTSSADLCTPCAPSTQCRDARSLCCTRLDGVSS